MRFETNSLPLVLTIGGHDPCGGAGIQADIEAVAATGAHALSLITCLTLQDSCNVRELHPVEPELLRRQAELLLADSPVSAVKVGLLGSVPIARTLAALLRALPDVPVVIDPVLAAGGGSGLAGSSLLQCLREELLPHCDLVTPNIPEALQLSELDGGTGAEDCARRLLELGARAVLITGTHDPAADPEITHHLYRANAPASTFGCARLAGEYHGSGCTLAAAIAAHLAQGSSLERAVERGLDYTWHSLRHGFQSGRCQTTPDRLFRLGRTLRDGQG